MRPPAVESSSEGPDRFPEAKPASVPSVNQRGRVIASDLETVAMRDGIGGARFHAISAENAAVVVDVVNLGVALAAADAQFLGVFGGFDIDAIGRARRRAQKTRHALLESVFIALQHVRAAETLLELRRAVGIILGDGRVAASP